MSTRVNRHEAEEFLRGEPGAVAGITSAIEIAVKSFRLGDPVLSQDLVQEAFSRIIANLSSGQFRGDSSLKTYAGRVARYTCLEHLRRRRLEVALDAEQLPCSERWSEPEESFLWTEEHLKNLEIFSSLPDTCRQLLKMVFVERLSYREIGLRLGLSEGAIKTRVHRCRAAFRECAGLGGSLQSRRSERKVRP